MLHDYRFVSLSGATLLSVTTDSKESAYEKTLGENVSRGALQIWSNGLLKWIYLD